MRVLAALIQPVEAETPYGGRAVSHETLGTVWLACGARRLTRRAEAEEGAARSVETMRADCRADDRVTPGRVLRFGGADWRIEAATPEADAPGRLSLTLERTR